MNEEALKYSFELFKKDGYSGDYEQYKQLISSDSEALKYSHQLFSKDGYSGNINDFTDLVGVKKKRLFASWLSENPTYKWLKACPIFK